MTVGMAMGSFRDRHNQVFVDQGEVLRGLSDKAAENWLRLSEEPFFRKLLKDGLIVDTEVVEQTLPGWIATLRHARIDPISYPYEWSFGMLKSAALFHLHILTKAIEADWTLKDASAYNIQWLGSKPIFIDVGSFEPYKEGAPWVAYRQFCMMFLYPLMLTAYRGVDFRPILRSSLDGISTSLARSILGWSSAWKPGVSTHVLLHSRIERHAAFRDSEEARRLKETSERKVLQRNVINQSKDKVLAIIDSMARLVRKLELPTERTAWGNYDQEHSYSDASFQAKQQFILKHSSSKYRKVVWDVGCNTGTFSRLAAPYAERVVAIDGDGLAIDRFYRSLKSERNLKILPLVMDLTNPSPNQGWIGKERTTLESRTSPDLVLCLALIHHLVLSANVPLARVVDWLRSLNCEVILEYVDLADPMSQMLVRDKNGEHHQLSYDIFAKTIEGRFEVTEAKPLKGGLRTVYHLIPV